MAQIDSLDIQITASVNQADAAIDKLIGSLTLLEKALSGKGISKFSKQMDQFAKSVGKASTQAKKSAAGMSKMANQSDKIGASFRRLPSAVNLFSSSLGKAHKQTRSFASVFGSLYANFFWVRRLFSKGLGAINIASDLVEVQNVVDVTFGKLAYKLDEFAQYSRQKFGLSELSLKTYASQFQAMFSAMGVTATQVQNVHKRLAASTELSAHAQAKGYTILTDSISDMSLNLTKLAADMGSFFNQNPEDVAKRLQAGVISGQSRALRQYGLDLTIATLQSYALARGIDADVQSMSQAEKTMLRYQYAMERMSMTMGDFERTSHTWANQIKLLKQNFQALGAVIGVALVGWIKPAIIAINNAMNTIIALVQKAVNAIGKLMGWQIEISSIGAGMAGDGADIGGALEDAADGAEDTAGGLGKANKAAKELKKTILAFDELNVLNGADKSGDESGAGGGAGGGAGAGSIADLLGGLGNVSGGNLKKYESDINSWFELGRRVSENLTKALENIKWADIYNKAENFGRNLADYLNGLISPKLFSALGYTIAGALNTALHFLDTFGTRFSWKNFGNSIAAGINRFFKEFKFTKLASTINKFAKGILDTVITAIDKTDWDQIGEQIGNFLLAIDFWAIGKKIGIAIWKAINAGFKAFDRMFETAPLETALLGLVGAFGGVITAINTIATLQKSKLFASLVDQVKGLGGLLGGVKDGFFLFHEALRLTGDKSFALNRGLTAVRDSMSQTQQKVMVALSAFAEFSLVSDAIHDITTQTGNLAFNIGELAVGVGQAGIVFSTIFGAKDGLLLTGVVAAIGAVKGLADAMNELQAERYGQMMYDALVRPNGINLSEVLNDTAERIKGIGDSFNTVSEKSNVLENATKNVNDVTFEIDKLKQQIHAGVLEHEEAIPRLIELYDQLAEAVKVKIGAAGDVVLAAFAEGGLMAKAFESAGLDAESMRDRTVQAMSDTEKQIYELTEELKTLMSAPDGERDSSRIAAIESELAKLLNGGSEVEEAMAGLRMELAKPLNWEDFMNGDSFDAEKFASALGGIKNSMTEVAEAADREFTNVQVAASKLSDPTMVKDIETALPGAITYIKEHYVTEGTSLLDFLQYDMIAGMTNAMETAANDWENMGYWERALSGFETKEQYVYGAQKSFQEKWVNPMSRTIEEELGGIAGKGVGWAEEAANQIRDAALTVQDNPNSSNGIAVTLSNRWNVALKETLKRIELEKLGGEIPSGLEKGMSSNLDKVESESKKLADTSIRTIKDTLEIRSPSKVMEEIGTNAVSGFVEGIKNNIENAVTIGATWVTSFSEKVQSGMDAFMTTMTQSAEEGLTTTLETFTTRLDEMQETASEVFDSIKDVTTTAFTDVKDAISDSIDDAKDVVDKGVSGIESIFSNMRFEFPDIKLPHFSWTTHDIGWGISLPSISIDWYANGGFPEDGLFMANHGELVGQFSNGKTAVANNEQIIAGIQGGVTRAIVQYLPEIIRDAVSAADTGGGDIYIGDEQIARAANRGNRKIDKRYNPAMQF